MTKYPRNKPCPCGSGKKFKKCCGDEAKLNAQQRQQDKKFYEAIARNTKQQPQQQKQRKYNPTMTAIAMAALFYPDR